MLALAKLSRASICRAFNRIYRTTAHTHNAYNKSNLAYSMRMSAADRQIGYICVDVWKAGDFEMAHS